MNGPNGWMKTGYYYLGEKIISGRWETQVPVAPAQRSMWIAGLMKKEKKQMGKN